MISEGDLHALYRALGRLDEPLDDLAILVFNKIIPLINDLELGALLSILLRERVLLPKAALRVSALFSLFRLYPGPISKNPFACVFLEYIEKDVHQISADLFPRPDSVPPHIPRHIHDQDSVGPIVTVMEKWIACAIVSGECLEEVGQHRPLDNTHFSYAQGGKNDCSRSERIYNGKPPYGYVQKLSSRQQLSHSEPSVSDALSAAVEIFVKGDISIMDLYELNMTEDTVVEGASDGEIASQCTWLFPPYPEYDLEWPTDQGDCLRKRDIARGLMMVAHERPLTPSQMKVVTDQIELYPRFLRLIGYQVDNFPGIIEHNPTIAIELVQSMAQSSRADLFLSAMIQSQVTLHSMEVFNGLLSSIDLPPNFISEYVSNCIQSCDRIKDRFSQTRQVRLC
ncbi:hypothetical protein HDU67_008326 [Dinochytrium kinnereticum]|nr:hypothetical protein HDU67_008326 [Dinochytrium kinnereticum]